MQFPPRTNWLGFIPHLLLFMPICHRLLSRLSPPHVPLDLIPPHPISVACGQSDPRQGDFLPLLFLSPRDSQTPSEWWVCTRDQLLDMWWLGRGRRTHGRYSSASVEWQTGTRPLFMDLMPSGPPEGGEFNCSCSCEPTG